VTDRAVMWHKNARGEQALRWFLNDRAAAMGMVELEANAFGVVGYGLPIDAELFREASEWAYKILMGEDVSHMHNVTNEAVWSERPNASLTRML
jgi:hypothetical protein